MAVKDFQELPVKSKWKSSSSRLAVYRREMSSSRCWRWQFQQWHRPRSCRCSPRCEHEQVTSVVPSDWCNSGPPWNQLHTSTANIATQREHPLSPSMCVRFVDGNCVSKCSDAPARRYQTLSVGLYHHQLPFNFLLSHMRTARCRRIVWNGLPVALCSLNKWQLMKSSKWNLTTILMSIFYTTGADSAMTRYLRRISRQHHKQVTHRPYSGQKCR